MRRLPIEGGTMRFVLALALGCVLSMAAYAEERPQGACRNDVQKFCKDVAPGGGAIARCLAKNESQLSEGCRQAIEKGREQLEEFSEACKADAQQLCKDVRPGRGRITRCLAQNKDRLSPACREKITQVEQRHPCMADMERFCKGVQPGGGAINRCLSEHQAQLAPACKAAFDKAQKKKQ
jgi:hypothetical protein